MSLVVFYLTPKSAPLLESRMYLSIARSLTKVTVESATSTSQLPWWAGGPQLATHYFAMSEDELRECRCPFCGELGRYESEAACGDHIGKCFALRAQVDRERAAASAGSAVPCRRCGADAVKSCSVCRSVSAPRE